MSSKTCLPFRRSATPSEPDPVPGGDRCLKGYISLRAGDGKTWPICEPLGLLIQLLHHAFLQESYIVFIGWSLKRMPMKTGDGDSSGIPSNVPAFLVKLWKLVEDPQYEEHISWNKVSNLCCFHFYGLLNNFYTYKLRSSTLCFCYEYIFKVFPWHL